MVKFRKYVPQIKFNGETNQYEIWVGAVKTNISYDDKFTAEYGLSQFKTSSDYKEYNKTANYNKLVERMNNEFTPSQMKMIEEFINFDTNYNNEDNFIQNEQ